jgi:hypothetical protein
MFDHRSSHGGSVMDEVALGQICSQYLGSPAILIPPTAPHSSSSSSSRDFTIDLLVADVPSELSLTQSHEKVKS